MKRVVVTGMGLVTPLGVGVAPSWERLINGDSGAARIENFEVSDMAAQIACQVPRGGGPHDYRPRT
ncbi:MAG: beta-ketoacyl-ACP synthase II, partial [Alphaproteobacteria bacterium]|nr:beta-ketoacyl-ACP synthase II [Alphaproteobacteria bacterium]